MPKLRKEVEDKIIDLIEQGYSNVEISEKMSIHRKTVASRRKAWKKRKQEQEKLETEKEKPIHQEQETPTDVGSLSEIAMIRLKQIHALLGVNSMDDMVEAVYADQLAADKYRVEYIDSMKEDFPEIEAPKTFASIIAEQDGCARDFKHDLDIYKEGFREDQRLIEELKAEAERQYEEGYEKGKTDHALLVPCSSCGNSITIGSGTEVHRLIVEFLREHRIIHNDCAPK